jgi:hypothetical protein
VTHHAAAHWLADRTGYSPGPDFRCLVSIGAGGVRGVVGFDGWTPNSVHMHVALDTPIAARELLRPSFAEAFANGRTLALGVVRAGNARILRLIRHLGFREAYRMKDGWAVGEDVVLFEMRREECRWLKEPT